jgi:hypothetical protein
MGPRFIVSCAQLFDKRGDTWLTTKERDIAFPLNASKHGDNPPDSLQTAQSDARSKIAHRLNLPDIDFRRRPTLVVDPDMDRYTKASLVVSRERYVDPKGEASETSLDRRMAVARLKINDRLRSNVIDVKPKPLAPHKVKGSFYRFPDVKEKIPEQTHYEPRPFIGVKVYSKEDLKKIEKASK